MTRETKHRLIAILVVLAFAGLAILALKLDQQPWFPVRSVGPSILEK